MITSECLRACTGFKKAVAVIVTCALFLSACATPGTKGGGGFVVGPKLSSMFSKKEAVDPSTPRPRLDVIIPVFDPGLPENEKDYDNEGVWPELRRAEANRYALKLKDALEKTNKFGAVRVTPDKSATGDIYIMGRIEESDGEEVEIDLTLYDISGTRWFSKSFDHEVDSYFHENIRNKGKDPYDPVFEEAATYIVEQLEDFSASELSNLKAVTELRFGASFSDGVFAQYLNFDGEKVTLIGLPSEDDPMLARIRAVRVRDQLFVDRLQGEYEAFNYSMNDSYAIWQKESMFEVKAARKANIKSAFEGITGALLVGLAIATAASNTEYGNYSPGKDVAAIGAGIGGVALLSNSFKTSKEAKVHKDALEELGKSMDIELAPKVVEFEKKTVELTGDASEQFAQWRAFLKQVYLEEATPDLQL
ncbi:MAG: hypothetical protein V7731_05775 [Amphritea sp.]